MSCVTKSIILHLDKSAPYRK